MDLFLEQDDNAETLEFVQQRNADSSEQLKDAAFEKDVSAIKALIERDDRLIVPTRRGKWLYDFRQSKDNPLGVWRRIPDGQSPTPDAPWETVFDLDAFCAAEGKRWIYRGAAGSPWDPSRVLLYLSDGGSDLTRLLEFDTETKAPVPGGFDTPAVRAHASWLSPEEICYFGSIDENSATRSGWPRLGRRLKRGQNPADAPVLYAADESDVTGSCGMLFPHFWKGSDDEEPIRFFEASHEIGKIGVFVAKGDEALKRLDLPVEIDIHLNHQFCLWRAKSGERYPVGSLVLQHFDPSADRPLREEGQVLFSPSNGQSVSQFAVLKEWALYVVSDRLKPRLFVLDLKRDHIAPVEIILPEAVQSVSFRQLDSDLHTGEEIIQVIGQGFLLPATLYRLDLTVPGRQPSLEVVANAPAYFDASGMKSELLEATSEDGTKVPYHIVFPKDWTRGELPVLQYGYGGFEVSLSPYYSGINGLWLEKGGAYVQAYIRGGGELGPDWHKVAMREGRHKAFEDFVAVARDLVKRGFTTPDRIACTGGSNGGLLTGVMATRYPHDFGAIWTRMPVIDMSRFHVFPAGKAWMHEYGNPDVTGDLEFMLAYSPLHNVKPASEVTYPPIYIESSTNDDRVHPSHARRFAHRLLEAGHEPLFHEFGSGGHGGAGNSEEQAARTAMGYSFLAQTILSK
ncbi:prolyl oligopeptidase family serine peptidase [Rhizobium oryzicola]|uniref:Prolyl oligopeptidase family serine peptidase n=1 Tax=Rhizobium oryzicola TaxID=1232668 RepID=A0ABT8SVH4_9HYPH|nr:prolyl oligopeptidase family serine peptidase [Rhizobium oryzicola]MDO1581707.1 prolyl oligopeptidase family serine peptidase [Rhizobium oryzicola]